MLKSSVTAIKEEGVGTLLSSSHGVQVN